MITVVIHTQDSARLLVPTLSALVAGSAEGLVREVLLADAGSTDGTEAIADAAGCGFLQTAGDLGERLRAAAEAARGTWLLFLDPASVLEEGWTRKAGKFLESSDRSGQAAQRAATFRIATEEYGLAAKLAGLKSALRFALTGRPRPEQGLLISKTFYEALGGNQPGENSQMRLFGKIGRSRLVVLRSSVLLPA
jgi:glycosyltransferase involved in cell wall biosynthesis